MICANYGILYKFINKIFFFNLIKIIENVYFQNKDDTYWKEIIQEADNDKDGIVRKNFLI